jgi:hypothetical protein
MQRKTILLLLLLKRCNDDRIFSAVNNPKSSHQRLKEGTCPAPFTSGPICYSCPSAELRTIEEVSFTPRPLYPHGKNSRYALPRNVSAHPPPPCLSESFEKESHLVHLLGIEPRFIFRVVL